MVLFLCSSKMGGKNNTRRTIGDLAVASLNLIGWDRSQKGRGHLNMSKGFINDFIEVIDNIESLEDLSLSEMRPAYKGSHSGGYVGFSVNYIGEKEEFGEYVSEKLKSNLDHNLLRFRGPEYLSKNECKVEFCPPVRYVRDTESKWGSGDETYTKRVGTMTVDDYYELTIKSIKK